MRPFDRTMLVVSFFCTLACSGGARGEFIVDSWILQSVVSDANGADGTGFNVVQSPFIDSHIAMLGDSWAETSYNLSFTPDQADFLIEADHSCVNSVGEEPGCTSGGQFTISTVTDLVVSFDAEYIYHLSGDPTGAMITARIFDMTSQPQPFAIFNLLDRALSFLDPNDGVLSLQAEVALPAGQTYRIDYLLDIDAHSDIPSPEPATGLGTYSIQITPEPGTAALILISLPFLFRRPRRRRCLYPPDRSPARSCRPGPTPAASR